MLSEPVSELADWPPYSDCVAPLSPEALRGDRIFTVPVPHEFHVRRLRRLLVAPAAAEEADIDGDGFGLELKTIPRHVATSADGALRLL